MVGTALSASTLFFRSVLAGLVAVLVELLALSWTDFSVTADLSLELTITHLTWLIGVGAIIGCGSAFCKKEYPSARFWFSAPCLIALIPFLSRQFGNGSFLLALGAIAYWCARTPSIQNRESVLVGSLTGAITANALNLFFTKHYIGRETDLGPTLTFCITAAVCFTAYTLLSSHTRQPLISTVTRCLTASAVVLGIIMAFSSVVGFTYQPFVFNTRVPLITRPPIVIVVLDTVRADHLELYNYRRKTMPNLTKFALTHGVVVERAISNSADSLSSHAALFTGLFPAKHGAHRPMLSDTKPPLYGYPLRPDVPTLAELLNHNGYLTAGVSGNHGPLSPTVGFGLNRGFDFFDARPESDCALVTRSPWNQLSLILGSPDRISWLPRCGHGSRSYRRAQAITDRAIHVVDVLDSRSFFLFVNYMDAHLPYNPPEHFQGHFNINHDSIEQKNDPNHYQRRLAYDEELLYLDSELTRLLDRLQRHPNWQNMLVIITSDHGEALGEHSLFGHTTSLYDVMIRIPLIFKFGRDTGIVGIPPSGNQWNRPMQLVDIMPIVLRHAGITAPQLDGRLPDEPLAPMRAWSFPSRTQRQMEPNDERFHREFRSLELSGWKLIEDDLGRVELYDLSTDAEENHNVSALHQERVKQMLDLLGPHSTYRAAVRSKKENLSNEGMDRLRSLGYIR